MIFRRLNLYSFTLTNPVPLILPRGDFRILLLQEKTPELSQICSEGLTDSRFSRGELCCCALHTSDAVSYCWIASDCEVVGEIERVVKLREGEVYLFDAFTSPLHRGKNLCAAILSKSLEWARSKGHSRALIFASSDNRPSVRAINRAGFKLLQTLTCIRLFGKTLCWPGRRTPGDKPIHLERSAEITAYT